MNAQEIKSRLNKIVDELVASGWNYDQARFAVMSAGAPAEGALSEQATGESHALLIEAADLVAEFKRQRSPQPDTDFARQAKRNEMHEKYQQ